MLTLAPGPEQQLAELAAALDPDHWMLVGGLMVHLHAHLAGVRHDRPTNDVDIVLLPGRATYAATATALRQLGYSPHDSLDHRAPFHRFTRGPATIDVMVATGRVRFRGRPVLAVPGALSATGRTVSVQIRDDLAIRTPDVASALSLKGAALQTDGASRPRHTRDGITLLACADTDQLDLSNSMRRNLNQLVGALSSDTPWLSIPIATRLRATRAIKQVRPDWTPPATLREGASRRR